jgi:hypothetical protein
MLILHPEENSPAQRTSSLIPVGVTTIVNFRSIKQKQIYGENKPVQVIIYGGRSEYTFMDCRLDLWKSAQMGAKPYHCQEAT